MTEQQKLEYKLYRKECLMSNVEPVLADFLDGIAEASGCEGRDSRTMIAREGTNNLPHHIMHRKQKINREQVQAALNTLCPKCGYSIPPAEIRRVDFNSMKCPKCGERFSVTKRAQS